MKQGINTRADQPQRAAAPVRNFYTHFYLAIGNLLGFLILSFAGFSLIFVPAILFGDNSTVTWDIYWYIVRLILLFAFALLVTAFAGRWLFKRVIKKSDIDLFA